MPTQAEIDAALETVSQPQTDSAYHYAAMEMLAYEYRKLIDPTPIAPELLEAEGFVSNHLGWQHGESLVWYASNPGEWIFNHGEYGTCIPVKTMGGVHLAMMLAGGER